MKLPISIMMLPVIGLSACAMVLDGPYQNVVVKTMVGEQDVAGAVCTLTNDKGVWQAIAPSAVTVRRSYDDLNVRCDAPGYVANAGSVPSSTRSLILGNVIAGGLIGTGIDIGVGSGYSYPSPIIVKLQSTRTRIVDSYERRERIGIIRQ